MTDTDGIAKAMVPPEMEQQQKREENEPGEKVDEQKGQTPPKVEDPTPQESATRDDLDKNYSEMAAEIKEDAQKKRDAVPKVEDPAEERKEHNDEISRLENEYNVSMKEDTTADMERAGTKEVLEVPNYRQHVSDDQMQGWGRALASFGSVGLKEGANAIDAATKALGEFRKLTRAFLSPNPMSPISQTVASTMVGFNTMYDTIDRAGEIAGIKQGADKNIVMETRRGAQYYKDKDNATRAANFIMQTFNDQIRDTLGPQGDVTQLNPAQFTRIYEKMKNGFFDTEIERIKNKYRTGQPLSLEDKAIVNGWNNLNENYLKVLKDQKKTANEYAKEVGGHEKAINDLNKQYDRDVKAYDRAIAAIDREERARQRSLGVVGGAPKAGGRASKVDDDPLGLLGATKTQRKAIVKMTPKQYSDRNIAEWKKTHVLETDQANSVKHRNLYKGAMDIVGKMAEEEREAYLNPDMSPEERADVLKKMMAYRDRLTDLEGVLWGRKGLEANDVFDESYRGVYNGMGRDEYLKTLPKRKKDFPRSKGKSRAAKEYNILIDDYEGRKDDLDMLRYDFLNGEFKDWRSRRNAILRGRHLNRLLDDQRDRLSTMYNVLSRAGKKNGMLPGYSFERPEPNGEVEQVNGGSDWEKGIDNMDESGLKEVIEYAAQDPTDEGFSQIRERAEKRLRELKSRVDSFNEQRAAQNDTEQKNNEDETVGADVQEESPVNSTESKDEFDTISEDLKTIDKEGLEKRIADLNGLDQDNPQVADLLRMAQKRLNAEQPENNGEPAVETEVPESDDTVVSEEMTEPPERLTYKTNIGKKYNDLFENILNNDEYEYPSDKRDAIGELLPTINRYVRAAKDKDVKKELQSLQYQMNRMWDYFNKKDSSTFDREQREKNAENLKAAEEDGSNPEHGETFNADTSIDGSKIRTPSEDPRRTDSHGLFKELLPSNKIMPEEIPEILRGIWPRGIETIDGKVYGTGPGNYLKETLLGAKNALEKKIQEISKYKKAPTRDTLNELAKKRDDLIEAWEWVINNMKERSNYEEMRRNTFEIAGNPIGDATNLIDGSWTPWKKSGVPFEELLKAKLNERYGHFIG